MSVALEVLLVPLALLRVGDRLAVPPLDPPAGEARVPAEVRLGVVGGDLAKQVRVRVTEVRGAENENFENSESNLLRCSTNCGYFSEKCNRCEKSI